MSRAVVVGGGLAGLTAALDLQDAGWSVTVLEARPRLGGAATSFTRSTPAGDLEVDTGQHVFLGCCTAYLGLLDRLGVRDLVSLQDRLDVPVWVDGRRRALRRGRLRPPLHLGAGLLRYLGPAGVRAVPAALRLARLNSTSAEVDARTFGGWLADHGQGEALVDRLWALLTVATLNCAPGEASLALAAKVVRTGLFETAAGADVGWADVPLGRLHGDAFARRLADVRTSCRVTAIACGGGGFVVTTSGPSGGTTEACDAVVLAAPQAAAAALLPPAAGVRLADLGASPIVNVHVRYDRAVLDVPFLATVGSPLQWCFDRTAQSGAARGQYVVVSLSAADRWIGLRSHDVLAALLPELARVLPAARGARVLDAFVTREPRATFRQAAGSLPLRPAAATALPGLVLAGAHTDTGWPATMEGAVRSGHTAARTVTAARTLVAA